MTKKAVPLTAKEAVYSYTSFRSQLEARWAVFFDVMGWDWDYEPSHYPVTDTLGYMPDFYLPRFGLWAEGKGSRYLDMASMRKCVNAVGGSRPLPLREPPYWPNNGLLMLGPVELDRSGGHPVHTLLLTTQVGHTGAWRAIWTHEGPRVLDGRSWRSWPADGTKPGRRPDDALTGLLLSPAPEPGMTLDADLHRAYRAALDTTFTAAGAATVPVQVRRQLAARRRGRPLSPAGVIDLAAA